MGSLSTEYAPNNDSLHDIHDGGKIHGISQKEEDLLGIGLAQERRNNSAITHATTNINKYRCAQESDSTLDLINSDMPTCIITAVEKENPAISTEVALLDLFTSPAHKKENGLKLKDKEENNQLIEIEEQNTINGMESFPINEDPFNDNVQQQNNNHQTTNADLVFSLRDSQRRKNPEIDSFSFLLLKH